MRRPMKSVLLPLVFAAFASAGTMTSRQENAGEQTPPEPAAGARAVRDGAAKKTLSEPECREYAQAMVRAVAAGDQTAVNALIDWDAILEAGRAGIAMTDKNHAAYLRAMRGSLLGNAGLASQLIRNSQAGGKFDYRRTEEKQKRRVILFRFIGPPSHGGINYFEFPVAHGPDDKIRAVDFYSYITGELATDTIHRLQLPIAASLSRTFLEKLMTHEQDYIRDTSKITSITGAINQGKMKLALAQMKELRPGTKREKTVLLMRLRAARVADQKDYVETIKEFRTRFPHDACLDLLLIDYHAINKDFAEAIECLNRLENAVGSDPYLTYIRATFVSERSDRAEARRLADQAIDREPSLQRPYLFLLRLSLEDKRDDDTLALLKKLHGTLNVGFGDLTTRPEFAGFVKSPQHAQWLQYLAEETKNQKKK